MAVGSGTTTTTSPRSVADATRFTSNTPHAAAKSTPLPNSSSSSPSASPSSSQPIPRTSARSVPLGVRGGGPSVPGSGGSGGRPETIDERVRRLRAAHLAAKQHDVSRMDRIIGKSRRFFDAAHRFTVMGLIAFSGLALLGSVYAAADMMMYNRKRRDEFFSLQKQLREDSLEAARLAYMTGNATPEQISLVENATEEAKKAGLSLPAILSAPQPAAPVGGREGVVLEKLRQNAAAAGSEEDESEGIAAGGQKKKGGITGWLFGGLKKEEARYTENDETLSADDKRWRTTTTTTTEELRDKAKAAFETERDNQRKGGPLDQVGLAKNGADETPKKKGWLW
ncbi:hypothetical protein F5Y16DRAFT_353695 [Xylariaceae sp. FL0255]|nr:hypothetical protein F5Y16DRAFT_353695 [Xylariaceae sp. FL0255]